MLAYQLTSIQDKFSCRVSLCEQVSSVSEARGVGLLSDLENPESQQRCTVALGNVSGLRNLVCVLLDP